MRKLLLTACLAIAISFVYAQTLTPRQLFPGLFEAIQLSDIFPDNKTFVDATPLRDPDLIMKDYNEQKDKKVFDLKNFVLANFTIPEANGPVFKSDISAGVRKHIDTLWEVLHRKHTIATKYSSLIPLPNDFIIPGGRFRETYYWDSYFTMLGLQESHKTKIIQDMIGNFAYLIDKYGFIPNGTRTYYLTRSQPPFFSMMIDLLAKDEGDDVLIKYQKELVKEYVFWMMGAETLKNGESYRNVVRMHDGEILNRYWDESDKPREESFKKDIDAEKLTKQQPGDFYRNIRAAAESGWDFSTRWMDTTGQLSTIQTTAIIPVDLNCLLYHLEQSIAQSYHLQGNEAQFKVYLSKAELRKKAILKYSWSEKHGWFMDYNWKQQQITPFETLAGVYPLEFKIADTVMAAKVAVLLKTKFLKSGGLVTTFQRSGQQWDSPNAWAPLQYMAIDGLNKYNQAGLARTIAENWMGTNTRVFDSTGKLMEKYNVIDTDVKAGGGEYPLQDGFGWTNGVLLNLLNKYHMDGL
ncbi:alpha,alpha-trehalase [Mucilaginibacter frigoritolerans]|uniref:Alpha,alpha-trehalase n=1 Tax=Mucilaginibacter frigoritolerans TaxID=652788 RepID=A0A562TRM5_9SPHI|nr:alpha,alpha-trehalase TreA [Mucilaginibacter frigoritolerans]TWI96241.1 alpha,alpha-trehalase [Mucilaginibacter frigoritolerans]